MESVERWVVVRPAILAVVATQNGREPPVLRGQGRVHEPPGFLAQHRQLARQGGFPSVLCFTMEILACAIRSFMRRRIWYFCVSDLTEISVLEVASAYPAERSDLLVNGLGAMQGVDEWARLAEGLNRTGRPLCVECNPSRFGFRQTLEIGFRQTLESND
jgi:hypothetical protein